MIEFKGCISAINIVDLVTINYHRINNYSQGPVFVSELTPLGVRVNAVWYVTVSLITLQIFNVILIFSTNNNAIS